MACEKITSPLSPFTPLSDVQVTVPTAAAEPKEKDYSKRSQWLRAAVLGANDGLISTASLMVGISAVKTDVKVMILTGFAGLLAGASSMAIGEFVSVYSQLDVEVAQRKRERRNMNHSETISGESGGEGKKERLPNPVQAAAASALAFAVGATVPLLAASFITDYRVRLGAMAAAVSAALVAFGWVAAVLGKASVVKSTARVVVGGWLAMSVTFGLTKLMGSTRVL